jgi:calcineurin-like phosphoesterase family protein
VHTVILTPYEQGSFRCLDIQIDVSLIDKVWLTSDMHFFHRNVINYCNRPFESVEHMNSSLISDFNSLIKEDDTLIMLGDMCFGGAKKWAETIGVINGQKILYKGNHDGVNNTPLVNMGIINALRGSLAITNGDRVCHRALLSHYPFVNGGDHTDGEERYIDRRFINDGQWLIHGHVHNYWKQKDKMINAGVDVWDMKPVKLREIIDIFEKCGERGG